MQTLVIIDVTVFDAEIVRTQRAGETNGRFLAFAAMDEGAWKERGRVGGGRCRIWH